MNCIILVGHPESVLICLSSSFYPILTSPSSFPDRIFSIPTEKSDNTNWLSDGVLGNFLKIWDEIKLDSLYLLQSNSRCVKDSNQA